MTIFEEPSIERIMESDEGQLLDFKSARIHPRDLANILVAFANADGGLVVIGIEKDRQITGTRRHTDNVQKLLRAAFDYCEPAVRVETQYLDCQNERGEPDQILLMQVARSSTVHNNVRKTVYLRIGDQNWRLGVQEVVQLAYDKGQANYESELARGASYDDLDDGLLKRYAQMIEASGDLRDLLVARELAQRDGDELRINLASVLLFGRKPNHWHPRPGIRLLRYEGTEALTGADMNIVKDRTIEQPLPRLLDETFALGGTLIRDFSRFGPGGKFVVTPEYPEFVWQEGITNTVRFQKMTAESQFSKEQPLSEKTGIEVLGLSLRAYYCLQRVGFDTVEQVAAMSDEVLLVVRNLNVTLRAEIREKLEVYLASHPLPAQPQPAEPLPSEPPSMVRIPIPDDTPIEALDLSIRSHYALVHGGVTTIDQLAQMSSWEILALRAIDGISLAEIQ